MILCHICICYWICLILYMYISTSALNWMDQSITVCNCGLTKGDVLHQRVSTKINFSVVVKPKKKNICWASFHVRSHFLHIPTYPSDHKLCTSICIQLAETLLCCVWWVIRIPLICHIFLPIDNVRKVHVDMVYCWINALGSTPTPHQRWSVLKG